MRVRYVSAPHLLTGMKVLAMFCWFNHPFHRSSQKFMGLDCVSTMIKVCPAFDNTML